MSHYYQVDEKCTCNFTTLLQIQECPVHPSRHKESIASLRNEFKMPNLLKSTEECTIVRQGWVKKKTTNIFLGFQERYLVLYSNKKLMYYKLLKGKINDPKYRNHWQRATLAENSKSPTEDLPYTI